MAILNMPFVLLKHNTTGTNQMWLVSSSCGGAVAMNINNKNAPLVLLCPSWKNWGSAKKLKVKPLILYLVLVS